MKRPRDGSTIRQYAYATRRLNGNGRNKTDIARSVGYAPGVAKNAATKIEKTVGYQNAVIKLAHESNNLVLAIMAEFKARKFKNFSNKDLTSAMNAIASAWEKFEKRRAPNGTGRPDDNPLKKVILNNRVRNQTIINGKAIKEAVATEVVTQITDDPMDF